MSINGRKITKNNRDSQIFVLFHVSSSFLTGIIVKMVTFVISVMGDIDITLPCHPWNG